MSVSKKKNIKTRKFSKRSNQPDNRFNEYFTNPMFNEMPKEEKDPNKIKVDPRFSELFTNPAFQSSLKVDKYGKKVSSTFNKTPNDFYKMDENDNKNKEEKNNDGYEGETESKSNLETKKKKKLSKKQRKIIKKIHKENNEDLDWDKAFNEINKTISDKEFNKKKSLLSRKPGEMFEYTPDNTSASSSNDNSDISTDNNNDNNKDKNNNILKYEELDINDVGEDIRAILDNKEDDINIDCNPSKRLAISNLDWDNVRACDIYVILRSFLPLEGQLIKVSIHPSEYGAKCMKDELKYGPSKNIWISGKLDDKLIEVDNYAEFINENEEETIINSDNEQITNNDNNNDGKDILTKQIETKIEEMQKLKENIEKIEKGKEGDVIADIKDDIYNKQMLRKYELQKLKYYYCVVECDTSMTADRLYQVCIHLYIQLH